MEEMGNGGQEGEAKSSLFEGELARERRRWSHWWNGKSVPSKGRL